MLSEKSFQKPEQCLTSNESDSNLHKNNNSCKNHPLKKVDLIF